MATVNLLQKSTDGSVIAGLDDSQVFDNGTNVGINKTTPLSLLDVNGDVRITEPAFATGLLISVVGGNARIRGQAGATLNLGTNNVDNVVIIDLDGNTLFNSARQVGTGNRMEIRTGFSGDNIGISVDNQSADTTDGILVNNGGAAVTLGNLLRLRDSAVDRFTITALGVITASGAATFGGNVTAPDVFATG